MFRNSLFLIFVTLAFAALGQAGQRPVFRTKSDSIQYGTLWALRMKLSESQPGDYVGMPKRHNTDSVDKALDALLKRATWQYLYRPRHGFTRYADLKSGKVNPDSVVELSIVDVRASRVPAEVLACKNLRELELVNTRIDALQPELSSLSKLNTIYLYNNIPSRRLLLGQNNTVTYLRIAGYHPEKLPASYKNFIALDSLNLNRSSSTKFPNIKNNPHLTRLMLVENNITLKRFTGSSSLTYLDLRRNHVQVVPGKIHRKFRELRALSLNSNKVRKVKPGVGKLEKLEYLSLYNNDLPEIPKPVYTLTNLKTIDLFHNRIEFIRPQIKNLQKLEVLYLANNRLYRLPDEIGLLKNLEELYVYNNRMDTLPNSMDKLEKLRILWVNDNFFHTIPATAWRAGKIDYLDASQNFIKDVPNELTEAPLRTLILSGALMNKEFEKPALFEKLRKQGTRIIYYTAASDQPPEEEDGL